jgi:hypothetical protein
VQPRTHRPEAVEHIGGLQCGELAQRADAEPGEERHQFGVSEQRDRQRGEERALLARRHDGHRVDPPRRTLRSEQPVGDTDPGAAGVHALRDAEGGERRRLLAPVVPGGAARPHGDGPGSHRMEPGHRLLEGGEQRLERPGIEGGVIGEEAQPGAAGLRLAAAHATAHAVVAGGRRDGEDQAFLEQRDRLVRRDAMRPRVGGDRPVGHPEHEQARRCASHAGVHDPVSNICSSVSNPADTPGT